MTSKLWQWYSWQGFCVLARIVQLPASCDPTEIKCANCAIANMPVDYEIIQWGFLKQKSILLLKCPECGTYHTCTLEIEYELDNE